MVPAAPRKVGSSTGGRGAAYALCSAADMYAWNEPVCFMVDDDRIRMAHIQVVEALEEIPFPYNSSVPS